MLNIFFFSKQNVFFFLFLNQTKSNKHVHVRTNIIIHFPLLSAGSCTVAVTWNSYDLSFPIYSILMFKLFRSILANRYFIKEFPLFRCGGISGTTPTRRSVCPSIQLGFNIIFTFQVSGRSCLSPNKEDWTGPKILNPKLSMAIAQKLVPEIPSGRIQLMQLKPGLISFNSIITSGLPIFQQPS